MKKRGWTQAAAGGALLASYVLGLGGEQVTEVNGTGGWVHTNSSAASSPPIKSALA